MERATNNNGLIRYRKIGGGSLRLDGKIIKPGQVFLADPKKIPKAFLDVLVPLDEVPGVEEKKPQNEEELKKLKPVFDVVPRGNSKVWFDVVNSEGKVINARALRKEVAEQLKHDLEQ